MITEPIINPYHPHAQKFYDWATERQLIVEHKEAKAAVERVVERGDKRGTHGARKRLIQTRAKLLAWSCK